MRPFIHRCMLAEKTNMIRANGDPVRVQIRLHIYLRKELTYGNHQWYISNDIKTSLVKCGREALCQVHPVRPSVLTVDKCMGLTIPLTDKQLMLPKTGASQWTSGYNQDVRLKDGRSFWMSLKMPPKDYAFRTVSWGNTTRCTLLPQLSLRRERQAEFLMASIALADL